MNQPNSSTAETNQEICRPRDFRGELLICSGSGCTANAADEIRNELARLLTEHNLSNTYRIGMTGCHGFCAAGPIMIVQPEGIFYRKLTIKVLDRIVREHLIEGKPVESLLFKDTVGTIPKREDIPFFSRQVLISQRNKGLIDPESIDSYIGRDGYLAFTRTLRNRQPEEVIQSIIDSGLRGRGGGGFPTGLKWRACRDAVVSSGLSPIVVCNADHGMMQLESDPHSVIEGMLIGAFAVGASEGVIYLRNTYHLARKRLEIALAQAAEKGFLGTRIAQSAMSFTIRIHRGAGAFIGGESSSVVASISGSIPEPQARTIRNAVKGVHGRPTVVNNVETWATVPVIMHKGADWFAAIGTGIRKGEPLSGSSGTKVFSLIGDIAYPGQIEIPLGTSLGDVIARFGGGVPKQIPLKAVQIGGPTGGYIPASRLDLKLDFDSLKAAGTILGSGELIVLSEKKCIADSLKNTIEFLADESCGQCTPCREGLNIARSILRRITEGNATADDLDGLRGLGLTMRETSMCQFGVTAANPILTALDSFLPELRAHIDQKRCPARVCKSLIRYEINAERCTGCTMCARACPVSVISGERKKPHRIDSTRCIRCGTCFEVCKFDAVEVK